MDYFENSVIATRAHRQFCIDLAHRFTSYSEDIWGITASDSVKGYVVWGGPPATPEIDGTVVPCAAAGSLMFTPDIALSALKHMRERFGDRIYGRYGFANAFNPATGWADGDVIGIDLGITRQIAASRGGRHQSPKASTNTLRMVTDDTRKTRASSLALRMPPARRPRMLATAPKLLAKPWTAPWCISPAAFESIETTDGHINPFPRAGKTAPTYTRLACRKRRKTKLPDKMRLPRAHRVGSLSFHDARLKIGPWTTTIKRLSVEKYTPTSRADHRRFSAA